VANLSVSARTLMSMSNHDFNNTETTEQIFDDPVAYLAGLGIEAEIVGDAEVVPMPAAA
jgi:hypothetical protein